MATVSKVIETSLPPVVRFEVTADCDTLKASFKILEKPSEYSTCDLKFRRYTRKCKPEGGAADNEWCTQEVWRILWSYKYSSDLSDKEYSGTDVELGEIACDCTCAKIISSVCVSAKQLASTDLQSGGKGYYTEYTVEFTADFKGVKKKWVQNVRVDGPRSWYGYSYFKCFELEPPYKQSLYATLAKDGLVPPGFELEPNVS